MRHVKLLGFFFAMHVFFISPVFAEESDSKVKLGGELRLRGESVVNQQKIVGGTNDDDAQVLLRARISVDARPIENLQIFLQPQFSRNFAQENSTIANGTDVDDLDLHQAFVEYSKIAGSGFGVKAGRQELIYGDQRLVGNFNWSNVARNFDALKLRYAAEKFWIDTFGAWIQNTGPNQYLAGLVGNYSGWEKQTLEPYVFYYQHNAGSAAADKLKIATTGFRFVGVVHERWDYGMESALQFGKAKPNNQLAYMGHMHGGYRFGAAWQPRIGLEYNHASGDKASTGKVERFHNLFPTNHDKYGLMDLVGLRNIHDLSLNISAKPQEKITLSSAYHFFLLPEVSDGLYRASGAQLRAGAAGASAVAGHELDLTASYAWNKYADFLLGYSFFKSGQFFADTGTSGLMHFAYVQAIARF